MAIDKPVQIHLDSLTQHGSTIRQTLAFFDMDRTLIVGYSALALVWESIRTRQPGMTLVAREMLANIDRRGGGRHYISVYQNLLKSLAGMPEAELRAAQGVAQHCGATLDKAWFYSDSADDLPLLHKVGHPVATNPSATLDQVALESGWPTLAFCSRGKPNLESVVRTALTVNTLVSTAAAGAASWLFSRSSQQATNRMTSWLGDMGVAFAGPPISLCAYTTPRRHYWRARAW